MQHQEMVQKNEESAYVSARGDAEGTMQTQKEEHSRGHRSALLWRREPATEQEAFGSVMPDEKKEGMVSTEHGSRFHAAFKNHHG